MMKIALRVSFAAVLLLTLAALPAAAQIRIPAGDDPWTTPPPPAGQTVFTFPAGDVEALCGAPASDAWDHRVALSGPPGSTYDTVVRRHKDVYVDPATSGSTPVEVVGLKFVSVASQATPCGRLNWKVGLAGAQGVTTMTLTQTSSRGGNFVADLQVSVRFDGYDAGSGKYVGSLFYAFKLPDPGTGSGAGTPWSIGAAGEFRAGMTETDNCIDVLREKLAATPTDSRHHYFISDLIAQGKCRETSTN